MAKRFALSFILVAVFGLEFVAGQAIKSFSDETGEFFSQLNTLFENVPNKDDKKACDYMLAEFTNAWNSGLLTKENKLEIVHVCNLMLKRRLKPYPDFYNYSANTDWVDAITQHGFINDQYFKLSGGGEKTRYFASVNYHNNTGTTINTAMHSISTLINLDYNVSTKIRF